MGWRWVSRCLPALGTIALLALLGLVSCLDIPFSDAEDVETADPSIPLVILVVYSLLAHLVFVWFPIRLSTAFICSILGVRRVLGDRKCCPPGAPTQNNEGTDVVHAIVVPNYAENISTLRTTLSVLASHPRARSQYEVYLAMEAKELEACDKSESLISEFRDAFLDIQATFHPTGLPGEGGGGKGANVDFASRRILAVHGAASGSQVSAPSNVIVTVIDADTHLWTDYFTEIRRLHQESHATDALRTIYTCPIIFDRNSNQTPFLVRCMDIVWTLACMSTLYPGSRLSVPVSVYSLPLALVHKVGGWDTDYTAIGEDFHMMLNCYFQTDSALINRVVPIPASQCNISSGGRGWRQFQRIHCARYRQAIRHLWGGVLDTGFAMRQIAHAPRFLTRPRSYILLYRLYETYLAHSHFLILQLFFHLCLPSPSSSTPLPPLLAQTIRLSEQSCLFFFIGSSLCMALYYHWYRYCLESRQRDMLTHVSHQIDEIGFSPHSRWYWHWRAFVEPFGIMLAGTVYGSLPALNVAFCMLWTDRLDYESAEKPVFGGADSSIV